MLLGYPVVDGSWHAVTSRELADQLLRLLAELGVVASMQIGRTADSTRDTYRIRISDEDQVGYQREGSNTAWVRVVGVEPRPFLGAVYSLEVPGVHTFVTTGGLVSPNCFPQNGKGVSALAERLGHSPHMHHA